MALHEGLERWFVSSTAPVTAHSPGPLPRLLALHEAADGYLARVRIPGGRLSGAQLRALGSSPRARQRSGRHQRRVPPCSCAGARRRGAAARRAPVKRGAAAIAGARSCSKRARKPAGGAFAAAWMTWTPSSSCSIPDSGYDRGLGELPGRFCFLVDDGTGARQRRPRHHDRCARPRRVRGPARRPAAGVRGRRRCRGRARSARSGRVLGGRR